MSVGIRLGMVGTGLLLAGLLAGTPRTAQAQQGTISGQVLDEATGTPLEAARVLLTGTNLIETTNREGRFLFRQVAPGTYQVRVLRVGYKPATESATVAEGETPALTFNLAAAVVQLDELVTTATGEQRKLEIGNAVTTIDAARVAEQAPITEFTNLISGRAPGVQVLKSSGTTGTGTRIRIRGSNSISLSNEPLYYLDGIRLESNPTSSTLDIGGFGSGVGAGPSRINDLNPDDIQDIEIVKGPAAATLYGIQASNGVIRVTTKRGVAGPPQWSLFSELGAVTDPHTYPLNYFGRDTTPTGIIDGYDGFCSIQSEIDLLCTQTSLQTFQPLNESVSRPYKAGLRQQHGASVSGGSEQVTYYVSGSYENEIGPFRLPQAEFDSVASVRGGVVPDNQRRPNALEKFGMRANVGANVSKTFDLSTSLGFTTSNTRFVENDNSFLTVNGSGTASGNVPEVNRGWYYIPAELFAELANQKANRFTVGVNGNWRPRDWLTARATVGYDLVDRTDVQFFPTGQVANEVLNRDGVKIQNAFDISQTSIDLGASARFRLSPTVGSRTSVGAQFFRDLATGTYASGRGLPPGSGTINGASAVEAADTTVEARSIGSYVEQEINFKERLFVTGALRFDDNSAFGQNFDATLYPKASVSWLVSDEPLRSGLLNTFRVRAAFGVSGQQPGSADALRFYNSVSGKRAGIGTTGVSFASLGNFDLKPERSREFEAGFDAGLFNDRVSLEFTFYSKLTRDALIQRDIAPSLGASQSQFVNLSRIRNRGVELAISTRVIDSRSVAWDLTLSGSTAHNKILDLGAGVSPIFLGFYQRHVGGYPAGGFWSPTFTYSDANSDGIIDLTEVALSDSSVFLGTPIPTREASLNSQLAIFGGQVVLGTQFDYRGGHKVDNSLEQFRCFSVQNCRGNYDRSASLEEQARAQALFLPGGGNSVAFLEPGWFIKLRELSLTFFAPDRMARAFRANRLSLTLSGRNLWTTDDYSGVDPEVNAFAQDNFASSDFESQAQVRYWTARLNIGF